MVPFFQFPRAEVNAVDNRVVASGASALGGCVSIHTESQSDALGVSLGGLTDTLVGKKHSAGGEGDLSVCQLNWAPRAALVTHTVAHARTVTFLA